MKSPVFVPMLMLSGIALAAPAFAQNTAPTVSNVQASQAPGTGDVLITYDVADADGDLIVVRLICSTNGGASFELYPTTIYASPDDGIGTPVPPGTGKLIRWNAAADYPGQYWPSVVAKVVASDGVVAGGEMVLVPGGEFQMGHNTEVPPQHAVSLNSYYIDKYEVSVAEYQAFIDAGGYQTQAFWSDDGWDVRMSYGFTEPGSWGSQQAYPGFPVHSVSWYEAEAYANFVGKRLPTEAEWEKAARGTEGGVGWAYAVGQSLSGARANFRSSGDPYDGGRTPVGFYDGRLHPDPPFQTVNSPGPYGTYDQCGNVEEWVNDYYGAYDVSAYFDPRGPVTGSYKIQRGGSWYSTVSNGVLKSWDRAVATPESRDSVRGFRCVRSVTP